MLMRTKNGACLTIRGKPLHEGALVHGAIAAMIVIWVMMLVMIPVSQMVTDKSIILWLLGLPSVLFIAPFVVYSASLFSEVRFEPDRVTMYWFGMPIQTAQITEVKLFCAVGNQSDDVLCMTCHTIEDMAVYYEEKLLRGFLSRHDVPFKKRKPDWQMQFAKGYINELRKDIFGIFKQRGIFLVEMKPEYQYLLRLLYPQLPYMNCTDVTSYCATRNAYSKDSHTVNIWLNLPGCMVGFEPDGLYLSTKNGTTLCIPAQEMKSLVRVDAFLSWHKHYPHHLPLVMVSCMSEEELAYLAPQFFWDCVDEKVPNRQALLAMVGASRMAMRFAPPDRYCCVLHLTENNMRKLREMYPHACFNDISACWLEDL